jgi:hypothetical protein
VAAEAERGSIPGRSLLHRRKGCWCRRTGRGLRQGRRRGIVSWRRGRGWRCVVWLGVVAREDHLLMHRLSSLNVVEIDLPYSPLLAMVYSRRYRQVSALLWLILVSAGVL